MALPGVISPGYSERWDQPNRRGDEGRWYAAGDTVDTLPRIGAILSVLIAACGDKC